MNDTSERVSVVMCTNNGAQFIMEQINSIINQTYPVFEFLIFDDASTDDTVDIIKNVALQHNCIKLQVNAFNLGFTKNFEQAIQAATGDLIAISDQDDIWVATKIEEMIAAWKPGPPLIYCESKLFSDVLPINPQPHPKWRRFGGTDARKIFFTNCISGHASIIKKELVPLIIPFDEHMMYDWWMGVVAAYNGGVQYYPKVLVLQRSHQKNVTVSNANVKMSEKEKLPGYKKHVIQHLQKFAVAPNIPDSHKVFATTFAHLLKSSGSGFNIRLFIFFMRYSNILFNYKKRKVAFFSHLKHSFKKSL